MRHPASRDTKNRAFHYWLAQHILGKGSSHMKAGEMKAGLNKHYDAIRAAKQPLPTAGQAKGVADERVAYSATKAKVLCELHIAARFRWDASLALPVSRYGATVRNLSVCDFTIAPHLIYTHSLLAP